MSKIVQICVTSFMNDPLCLFEINAFQVGSTPPKKPNALTSQQPKTQTPTQPRTPSLAQPKPPISSQPRTPISTQPRTPTSTQAPTPTAGPSNTSLHEVDLFSSSSSKTKTGPRSPVKTNPFENYDRPVRLAKLNPEAERYGPAMPKKVTRVLSGEERAKLEQSLKDREAEKNFKLIR